MTKVIIVLLCAYSYVSMFEIVLEKVDFEYYNPKVFNSLNGTVRRFSRKGPYVINLHQDLKTGIGNNLTIKWSLFEVIAGHHVLTPLHIEYGLCDFLYKDQYVGKMIADQLPENWKCPFPSGIHHWTNMALHFEYFPFIPFTYSSLIVRVFVTIDGYIDQESAYRGQVYGVIKQKLQDMDSKKNNRKVLNATST